MKVIAELIIAFFDLLEAEGRTLRRAVVHLAWGLTLLFLVSLLILTATGFFLVSIYLYLSSQFTPSLAALITSLVTLLLALFTAGIAHWRMK
ncbi:MAG TPA: hypothetical protein VLX29_08455 [Nitrospirota bacterium]|nr:hypothetical protein [Nitrospirota bacterium]